MTFIRFLCLQSKSVLHLDFTKSKITNAIYYISTCKHGNIGKPYLNETHKDVLTGKKGYPFRSRSTVRHFHPFNDRIFLRKTKFKCSYGNRCLYTTCTLSFQRSYFITLYCTSLDPLKI